MSDKEPFPCVCQHRAIGSPHFVLCSGEVQWRADRAAWYCEECSCVYPHGQIGRIGCRHKSPLAVQCVECVGALVKIAKAARMYRRGDRRLASHEEYGHLLDDMLASYDEGRGEH